jgi:hypothetical protein
MAMKAIHNFVVMGFTFRHNNRLGESIEFQRLAEQPFFRRGNVIGVVVVSDNRVLFDPENAVYRLLAKGLFLWIASRKALMALIGPLRKVTEGTFRFR